MKKLTLTAASLLAALSVYAQGTVDFNNFLNTEGGVINGVTGQSVSMNDGVVAQLYWSATMDGVYVAAGAPTMVGSAFGTPFPGYFGGGTVTIPEVMPPGSAAYFEVRAWESSFGATFEEATQNDAALRGVSDAFMSDTGNPGAQPPDLPADLGGLIPTFTVNVVPEPSVVALGLLGAGTLLLLRRRK
jgi:hypothetical protein